MTLKVVKAGPLSLIQDFGRMGYQGIGVACGGPMDELAFCWANKLLDNESNAAQVEIVFGQFWAEFTQETMIALTGADMDAELNDMPITPWASYYVKKGSVLKFKTAKQGIRAYLAIKGGFDVLNVLNSSATVVRDEFGGLSGKGEKLQVGDELKYACHNKALFRQVPSHYIPNYPITNIDKTSPLMIEMIPSYQYEQFSQAARQMFFNTLYTITPQSDRMGYRLAGERVAYQGPSLISEGIALGAIQVPADGQPIILMRDHQTIGGYPKLGCVTLSSLSLLAQCLPGTQVQFKVRDRQEAEQDYREMRRFFI